jgi:hypothetical protein
MNRDNLITLAIFSIFITAPFISIALEKLVEAGKRKINKRLAKHGLRLKERV